MAQDEIQVSLHGRRLGITTEGNLAGNSKVVTMPCVDAEIVVADAVSTTRAITIQLKDINGNDINYVETVELILFLNAGRTAFAATGGSTGIAIGTDGALLALVAKKVFLATSEADGDIDLTFTDNASEVCFLGVRLPNGRIVMSSALTI